MNSIEKINQSIPLMRESYRKNRFNSEFRRYSDDDKDKADKSQTHSQSGPY
jgi:hypothetical protein